MISKISFIFLFIFTIYCFPQSDFKIISSDYNSVTIDYTPNYIDTSIIVINNQNYFRFNIYPGSSVSADSNWGMPNVPVRSFNVGVPNEFGNTIQVLNTFSKEINGRIVPIPFYKKVKDYSEAEYKLNPKYNDYRSPQDIVQFGEFGIARGIPVQKIIVNPVNFNPRSNKITLFTKIIFKVSFSKNQKVTSGKLDDLMKGSVINLNIAKHWIESAKRLNKITLTNSVLATGTWVRFEAPEDGIYKIDKNTLQSFGLDPSQIDPRTIKIYNNGGYVLPELVSASAPNDLIENAITVVGQDDGKFDDGDYILFYGRGTNFWYYDSTSQKIIRAKNPYSKVNYYWITYGGNAGKRIENEQSSTQQSGFIQNNTQAFKYLDDDKINILKSGRDFVGDAFNESLNSRTYINKLENLVPSSTVNYKIRFINTDLGSVLLNVQENNSTIFNSYISGRSYYTWSDYAAGYATEFLTHYNGNLSNNRSALKITFNTQGANSQGYLDYYEIQYQANLKPVNDRLVFFSIDTSAVIEYDLSGFSNSNIKVYDVTDFSNVKLITNPLVLSGGEFRFRKFQNTNSLSKFVAVGADSFLTPINPEQIENSNLHGIDPGAKLIIVTNKLFHDQAVNYKNYRENQSPNKMSAVVVDIDKIFNEFSCGMTDVSGLRNFIKYAYDNWTIKPEYVLLFGDGTYDYKNIEGFNNNYVITYQTAESMDGINSYTTDDYFVRVDGDDRIIDLSIGRLNINSNSDAENVINKIIYYENQEDKGNWRNLITLVADDGKTSKGDDGNIYTAQSENLAGTIIPSSFDLNKIYLAEYPAVITGEGRRKPEVNKAIIDAMNAGTVLVNYIGHGNPDVWTHEIVFDRNISIPQINNLRYFFLTAATCDFGYYDRTNIQSGSEDLVLKPDGGAIGVFSASRIVFAGENAQIMYTFFDSLMNTSRDSSDLPITVGKAFYLTLHAVSNSANDQKYHLFCDPTIRLNFPHYKARIDSLNHIAFEDTTNIQVKALGKISINGSIRKPDSTKWNNYNGEAVLTVFDSQRQVLLPEIGNYPITVQGGILFRGRISVTNGNYSANFVVPKDISYENKKGKIVVYFFNSENDGIGYTKNIIVGGTDSTTSNDGSGPDIQIYFDNTNYKNSYLVNPNSELIVKLSDETGLNTTGTGIGHKLEGILNDNETSPLDFTNYFTGDLNSGGKSGEINYKFDNLPEGEYQLKVKAWDVFNNFSTETAYFSVVSGNDLAIRDVYNYPNPFASNTTFTFQQNLDRPLNVRIKIYTIAGRLIKEIKRDFINDKFVKIYWNGRDEDGSIIANGTYLYKIIVQTADGQYNKSVLGKLAVIK